MEKDQKFCHSCGQFLFSSEKEHSDDDLNSSHHSDTMKVFSMLPKKQSKAFIWGTVIGIILIITSYFIYTSLKRNVSIQEYKEREVQELIEDQNIALEQVKKEMEELQKNSLKELDKEKQKYEEEISESKKAIENINEQLKEQKSINELLESSVDYSVDGSTSAINFAEAVAQIFCSDDIYGTYSVGSGTIWYNNSIYWILTNEHVLEGEDDCFALVTLDWGSVTEDVDLAFENNDLLAYKIPYDYYYYTDPNIDLAYAPLEVHPDAGQALELLDYVAMMVDIDNCNETYPIGTDVQIFGYPGIGSNTVITLTEGIISSWEKIGESYYYLVSAKIDGGNSGGGSFVNTSNNSSCFVGIPTFSVTGEMESLGRILVLTEEEIGQILTL